MPQNFIELRDQLLAESYRRKLQPQMEEIQNLMQLELERIMLLLPPPIIVKPATKEPEPIPLIPPPGTRKFNFDE